MRVGKFDIGLQSHIRILLISISYLFVSTKYTYHKIYSVLSLSTLHPTHYLLLQTSDHLILSRDGHNKDEFRWVGLVHLEGRGDEGESGVD